MAYRRRVYSNEWAAGRRGLDDDIIVQMVDQNMDVKAARPCSSDTRSLASSFRLSYNMVLNMLRLEDVDIGILSRCP